MKPLSFDLAAEIGKKYTGLTYTDVACRIFDDLSIHPIEIQLQVVTFLLMNEIARSVKK